MQALQALYSVPGFSLCCIFAKSNALGKNPTKTALKGSSGTDFKAEPMGDFKLYLAPMLDVTTPHFRSLVRLTSKETVLFTEMIVAEAAIHMPRSRLVETVGQYDENTVVQIGGSNPETVSKAVSIIAGTLGFRKFNLNCGCPSSRVRQGRFGAVLMLSPGLVSEIVNTVDRECGVVLSLKIRIGVDSCESYEFVHGFIREIVQSTRCNLFFVHARKCCLSGLSPSENRSVPPLKYEYVHMLKLDFPAAKFILNGGVSSPGQLAQRGELDGFMLGRAAVKNVFIFRQMEAFLKGGCPGHQEDLEHKVSDASMHETYTEDDVASLLRKYLLLYDRDDVVRKKHVFPLINLMHGTRGCRRYKQHLLSILAQGLAFKDAGKVFESCLGNAWQRAETKDPSIGTKVHAK